MLKDNLYAFDFHFKTHPYNLILADINERRLLAYFPYNMSEVKDVGQLPNAFQLINGDLFYKPVIENQIYTVTDSCVFLKYRFLPSFPALTVSKYFMTEKYVFFYFKEQKKKHLIPGFYNSQDNSIITNYLFVDDLMHLPFCGMLCGSDNESLYFTLDPSMLQKLPLEANNKIEKKLGLIHTNDNPIIGFAFLK